MSRASLDATVAAELVKPSLRAGNLFRLQFPSGTIYATNMGVNVAWNGWTFITGANVLSWTGYSESSDLRPRGVDFRLSMTPSLISAALLDNYANALCDVWLAVFDQNYQVLGTPYSIAPGVRMSSASLAPVDKGGEITMTCETGGIYFDRDSATLCSGETQRRRYPGDTSLDKLRDVAQTMVDWGGKISIPGNPTNGGGGGSAGNERGGTRPVRP